MDIQDELKNVNKQIFIINLIGTPGAMLIGFSLYAIFKANGDAFHPALNNLTIVYNMLIFGIAIEVKMGD